MLRSLNMLCGIRSDLADIDISHSATIGRRLLELWVGHSLVFWRGSAPVARHEAYRGRRLSRCRHQVDLGLRCCCIVHNHRRDHRVNIVLLQRLGEVRDVAVVHSKHWSGAPFCWDLHLMVRTEPSVSTYYATAHLATDNDDFVLLAVLQRVNQRLAHISRSSGDCNDDHWVCFQVADMV